MTEHFPGSACRVSLCRDLSWNVVTSVADVLRLMDFGLGPRWKIVGGRSSNKHLQVSYLSPVGLKILPFRSFCFGPFLRLTEQIISTKQSRLCHWFNKRVPTNQGHKMRAVGCTNINAASSRAMAQSLGGSLPHLDHANWGKKRPVGEIFVMIPR